MRSVSLASLPLHSTGVYCTNSHRRSFYCSLCVSFLYVYVCVCVCVCVFVCLFVCVFCSDENKHLAQNMIRFAFCQPDDRLDEAIARLAKVKAFIQM